MNPINTSDCNFTYTAPAGAEDQVGNLPCERSPGRTRSWWKPSEEERLAIASGGLIEFTAYMDGHPVVSLGACQPAPDPIDADVVTPAMAALVHRTIVDWHFAMIFPEKTMPDLGPLDGFSLAQLVTAVLIHESSRPKEDGFIQPTVDDRLVAACYTFLHYKLRPQDTEHEIILHDGKQALYIAWGKGHGPGES